MRDITLGKGFQGRHADVLRLYTAIFDRDLDLSGTQYWIQVIDGGASLNEIAGWFADSDEFQATYGSTTNRQYLEIVYRNVLGRSSDQGGFDYWLGELEGGLSRGGVVRWVAANDEFISSHPYPDPIGASPNTPARPSAVHN